MKALTNLVTRHNVLRALVLIACINLYLLLTSWLYGAFLAACCLIVVVVVCTKKINGIYYFLHTDKYRIAFVTPKVWVKTKYHYQLKKWFFSYFIFHPNCNTEIKQLYILGFGFGIKINK